MLYVLELSGLLACETVRKEEPTTGPLPPVQADVAGHTYTHSHDHGHAHAAMA
jgi:hypothetical protein